MPEFRVPPLILSGEGCAGQVGTVLAARDLHSAFVVSDPHVLAREDVQQVLDSFREAGLMVSVHDRIVAEPTVRMVEAALVEYRRTGADVVVGIGGGSPMDVAKSVAVLANNDGPLPAYEGIERIPRPHAPLVCIAATAGTGSEVTRYVAVTDEARDRKMLITSWHLLPDVAVADPCLTLGLPAKVTVSTGVDALTHAMEAYVSKRVQPLSEPLALSAIQRVGRSLRTAYAEPHNLAARADMSLAALEAGIAFCNASVALVHGMARPLGAYFGVPHGLANAVLLARVTEYSAPGAPERYRAIAAALGEPVAGLSPEAGARAAVAAVDRLCANLDVPRLGGLGMTRARFQEVVGRMAADAVASGSPGNNPRLASADDIVALYQACY